MTTNRIMPHNEPHNYLDNDRSLLYSKELATLVLSDENVMCIAAMVENKIKANYDEDIRLLSSRDTIHQMCKIIKQAMVDRLFHHNRLTHGKEPLLVRAFIERKYTHLKFPKLKVVPDPDYNLIVSDINKTASDRMYKMCVSSIRQNKRYKQHINLPTREHILQSRRTIRWPKKYKPTPATVSGFKKFHRAYRQRPIPQSRTLLKQRGVNSTRSLINSFMN